MLTTHNSLFALQQRKHIPDITATQVLAQNCERTLQNQVMAAYSTNGVRHARCCACVCDVPPLPHVAHRIPWSQAIWHATLAAALPAATWAQYASSR
jgi:hypothetical protein